MFEFTKRSRKVLEEMSQAEGRRLNSDSLGPEHIFIALLNDEDSVADRIMKNWDLTSMGEKGNENRAEPYK
jgi:ATP-dependent Clp protease ATP-binding subunit ClpC